MSTEMKDTADKPVKKGGAGTVFSVAVDAVAHRQVTAQAKKLKVSQREYASAAIAYFAESGLDPTKERPQGLAAIASKVGQETFAVRKQNVEIGERQISIIRQWEKTLYGFLQQQQAGTLNYLEQIENNILRHQAAVESDLLAPLVKQVIQANVEAQMARVYAVRTHHQLMGEKEEQQWLAANQGVKGKRDQQLLTRLRTFTETNKVTLPSQTPKPQVPATPAKSPMDVPGVNSAAETAPE